MPSDAADHEGGVGVAARAARRRRRSRGGLDPSGAGPRAAPPPGRGGAARFRAHTGGAVGVDPGVPAPRRPAPRDRTSRVAGGGHGPDRCCAAIEWSYDLLDEPQRQAFERASLFSGGLTLPAAEPICTGDLLRGEDVADVLGALVDSRCWSSIGAAPRRATPCSRPCASSLASGWPLDRTRLTRRSRTASTSPPWPGRPRDASVRPKANGLRSSMPMSPTSASPTSGPGEGPR